MEALANIFHRDEITPYNEPKGKRRIIMRKVDLENNYIRNDISITEEIYKEMRVALATHLEQERKRRKQLMINKIVDTLVWLLIALMIVTMFAYVVFPGGYWG